MAKNETKVGVKVTDDGSLKETGRKAKQAGKNLKGMTDQTHSADRAMKGISNQSSNTTKNFSKMSQGLTGGLVPAYATLAANVFALSAAFRFLQQAADFKILIEGQKQYAAVTGVAYQTLTKTIQDATDGQIRYQDAAQAAAIGTAAGLQADQLFRLGEAAKLASIALGRDVTDSFNRLIRGTTKAEPELLDELGIILRLDTALEKYATQINKSKNELSQFEKSQAITNDVLEQAESKFGIIAELMDPEVNKINQMAKSFDDLQNSFKLFIAGPASALATFFSENLLAAAGALALIATPIISTIIPSFEEFEQKSVRAISRHNMKLDEARAKAAAFAEVTTRGQAQAAKGYAKSLQQAQALSMGVAPGRAGSGLAALQGGGKLTGRQLGNLRSQLTREVGIFKNMDAQIRANWKATLDAMAAEHKVMVSKVAAGTKKLQFNWQATSAKIQVTWEKAMLGIKRAQTAVVSAANKALGAIGWISVGFLLIDILKQAGSFFGLYGDSADTARHEVQRLADVQSNLNDEIERMLKARKLMLEDENPAIGMIAKTGGQMVASAGMENLATFNTTITEQEAKMAKMIKDGTAFKITGDTISKTGAFKAEESILNAALKGRSDLADRMDAISESDGMGRLRGIGDRIRAGIPVSKIQDDFIATLITGTNATKQLDASQEKFNKTLNDGTIGRASAAQQLNMQLKERIKLLQEERASQAAQGTSSTQFTGAEELAKLVRLQKAQQAFIDGQEKLLARENELKSQAQAFGSSIIGGTMAGKRMSAKFKIEQAEVSIGKKKLELNKLIDQQSTSMSQAEQEQFNIKKLALETEIALMTQSNEEAKKAIDPLQQIGAAAAVNIEQGLSNAIVGVIDGTKSMKEGFLDMAKAVLQAIAQIIAKLIAMKAIESAAMAFGFPIPFARGGIIPMAGGGIRPKGYRGGGIATEPTYLVGEGKHNEAIVPLPDGRSIPVEMRGGVGGSTIVNVNISGDGQTTSNMTSNGGQRAQDLGKAVSAAVQEEMLKQQRPGGLLSPIGGPS